MWAQCCGRSAVPVAYPGVGFHVEHAHATKPSLGPRHENASLRPLDIDLDEIKARYTKRSEQLWHCARQQAGRTRVYGVAGKGRAQCAMHVWACAAHACVPVGHTISQGAYGL